MIHVGIDLGTTFSLIAHVNMHGVPTLFPDYLDANEFRTPSVVYVEGQRALVGSTVEALLDNEPSSPVARHVKLKMGNPEPAYVDAGGRSWTPPGISALILQKLLKDSELFANDRVETAVIAVPAQFGDHQRRATRNAAKLAGSGSPMLLEEPVAAATFYGYTSSQQSQVLFVYDLGGGTFDASVLQVTPQGLYVLATDGIENLGGKVFDEALVQAIEEEFRRVHRADVPLDATTQLELRRLAEQIKIKICKPGAGQVRQVLLIGGRTLEFIISRSQFEALIAPLVSQTMEVCGRCLESAGLSWKSVDRVLLTGGSSLIPYVQNQLKIVSQKPGDRVSVHQPHQAIAYGAAIVSGQMAGNGNAEGPSLVQNISFYDLGIRVQDKRQGPVFQPLIRRNMPLPAKASTVVYTTRPDQRRMVIEVVQSKGGGERALSLGHFSFGPIQSPRKNYPIELLLSYSLDGMVQVSARDLGTGEEMEQVMADASESDMSELLQQRETIKRISINE